MDQWFLLWIDTCGELETVFYNYLSAALATSRDTPAFERWRETYSPHRVPGLSVGRELAFGANK